MEQCIFFCGHIQDEFCSFYFLEFISDCVFKRFQHQFCISVCNVCFHADLACGCGSQLSELAELMEESTGHSVESAVVTVWSSVGDVVDASF